MKRTINNFGRNIRFKPDNYYEPAHENEVLEILQKHAHDKIRAIGSLHSWSDIAASDDTIINLKKLNKVEIHQNEDSVYATIGGGIKLRQLLKKIHPYTLPTHGAVLEQTIAGAIATATHGSGATSMSDMIDGIRLIAYDSKTGKPGIFDLTKNDDLQAARCHLGAMGIIVEVKIKLIKEYHIQETLKPMKSMGEILKKEDEYPLQQFFCLPWSWKFYSFLRRKTNKPDMLIKRLAGRVVAYLFNDVLFHATLTFMVNTLKWKKYFSFLYHKFLPIMLKKGLTVSDNSRNTLSTHHEFFRHVEMELFIPADQIEDAFITAKHIIEYSAGKTDMLPEGLTGKITSTKLKEELTDLKGIYHHHFPLFFRKVLPDQRTLMSLTAGSSNHFYTMSFFSYSRNLTQFFKMADCLARTLVQLHDALPHWGKYYPLTYREVGILHPRTHRFTEICSRFDPNGTFTNNFTKRVLDYT